MKFIGACSKNSLEKNLLYFNEGRSIGELLYGSIPYEPFIDGEGNFVKGYIFEGAINIENWDLKQEIKIGDRIVGSRFSDDLWVSPIINDIYE
jgi:hypothetical protein